MQKETLLQMVQSILSSMESDSVNSISDTQEAMDVALDIKETYDHLMSIRDWEHLKKYMQLEALVDTAHPNYLKIPNQVVDIHDLRYDCTLPTDSLKRINVIKYMSPTDFITMVQGRSNRTDVTTVYEIDGNVPMYILNDKMPQYWTCFDNQYIVFDAWDSLVDSTLQSVKSQVYATLAPSPFTIADSFVPDLPVQMFQLLKNEAAKMSHTLRKREDNPIATKRALAQLSYMRDKQLRHNGKTKKGFGRR